MVKTTWRMQKWQVSRRRLRNDIIDVNATVHYDNAIYRTHSTRDNLLATKYGRLLCQNLTIFDSIIFRRSELVFVGAVPKWSNVPECGRRIHVRPLSGLDCDRVQLRTKWARLFVYQIYRKKSRDGSDVIHWFIYKHSIGHAYSMLLLLYGENNYIGKIFSGHLTHWKSRFRFHLPDFYESVIFVGQAVTDR